MAETVIVKPELIRWAIDRSRLTADELAHAFPKLDEWQRGERMPTVKQLEQFASRTMTPFGYFFLDSPPDEKLTIVDFRTFGDTSIQRPSPNLIDTIQTMQRRQSWMREYLIEDGHDPLEFVGSAKNVQHVVTLANRIRETLGLDVDWAKSQTKWEDAVGTLRNTAERIGILVATNSIVGNKTRRPLDPIEFRGFVLCDDYAPLIFVNSNDTKSAQIFTLAHELAHVWIGRGGLFNLFNMMPKDDATERFCNQVAAEFLIPEHKISQRWMEVKTKDRPFHEIAKLFKVSPVVAARRALDLGLIGQDKFFDFYKQDQTDWQQGKAKEKNRPRRGGLNFYDVQDKRLGKRFAYAVVRAAREGRLLYREAYKLTDLKGETFDRYANRLMQGVKGELQ